MHCGYVVKVEKLNPHPNADRLLLAEFFGNTTCVSTVAVCQWHRSVQGDA